MTDLIHRTIDSFPVQHRLGLIIATAAPGMLAIAFGGLFFKLLGAGYLFWLVGSRNRYNKSLR